MSRNVTRVMYALFLIEGCFSPTDVASSSTNAGDDTSSSGVTSATTSATTTSDSAATTTSDSAATTTSDSAATTIPGDTTDPATTDPSSSTDPATTDPGTSETSASETDASTSVADTGGTDTGTGGVCGWLERFSFYDCSGDGADPSNEFPLECPAFTPGDECDENSEISGIGCCTATSAAFCGRDGTIQEIPC